MVARGEELSGLEGADLGQIWAMSRVVGTGRRESGGARADLGWSAVALGTLGVHGRTDLDCSRSWEKGRTVPAQGAERVAGADADRSWG